MNNDAHGEHSLSSGPGHEKTDISVRAVAWFLLALGGVLVLTGIGVWWFLEQMSAGARSGDAAASPAARRGAPPAPQLQVSARADMQALRQAEQERLSGYGWVDRQNGVVHIPISEAIERVARDGPPRWPEASTEAGETEAKP